MPPPVAAPLAIEGRFYFEVGIHGNCRAYWPRSGIFDSTFLPTVLRYQDATRTPDESVAYQAYKQQLVERILHAPKHGVFSNPHRPLALGKVKEARHHCPPALLLQKRQNLVYF